MPAKRTTSRPGRTRRGAASAIALLALSAVGMLAVAFANRSVLFMHASHNHHRANRARLAAESGVHYAMHALRDFVSTAAVNQLPDLMDQVHTHLVARVPPSATITYTQKDANTPGSTDEVNVSGMTLPDGQTIAFRLYVSQWSSDADPAPEKLTLKVTGGDDGLHRAAQITFDVEVDKRLLHYAMASTLRVIARGDVVLHGPVTSSWGRQLKPDVRNKSTYPLDIQLGENGWIHGAVGTTLSKAEFTGDPDLGDSDFHNGIRSDNPECNPRDDVVYDEPDVMTLNSEDFDTSPLKAMTATENLPDADDESFSLGVYSITGKRWKDHNGTDKPALNNIRVAKGTNPYFENCTFTGITYIEVDEETDDPTAENQNSVIFKDCTFQGPIITGVPKCMDWENNCMQFQGSTVFNTSMIQAALGGVTLMAPNYNVNIGGSENGGGGYDSDVCGLVIGGCVDLYNDIAVKGTVISMAEIIKDGVTNVKPGGNDSWLAGGGVCGSNIGNLDGSSQNISITPDPDNVIPLGIKKRFIVEPRLTTYQEVSP